MANPLLKYAKDKKTSQSDYQQTNQGAQNPDRTDGSQTGTGNTNPLLKYANSVSSAPAAPAASSPGAADVSSPSTSPSSDSLSALKKRREDIYNSIDRRRAEMDRQYSNDVYKQLTEIDGKIDRIENPGREDAGEAYRKAKRTYEAELAYGDADTRAAAKKALEEKKADFSAAGGNPDATIVGSALKEYAGSLATGFGVLSATSGLGGMNPEELPADYEMQRALLDQARKNSSGQNDEINSIVERGQKLVEEGAMGVESAKAGRSAAGKFLVDLAVQATMMGGDMLLGLATGGGMAPLIARSYGGSVNEAITDGADYNMASLYGAAAAATEAFTERMFDGFAQVYGQGDSTKLVSYVSGKLAKTDAGRLAWQYIINGMGEGVEEVVSDLVNPLVKTIYNGKKLSQNYKDLNIGDIAYDFIVGAALGYSGVAVEAIGGAGMSDTAKFFSDAAGNGMSFKEACKLYEAMWTAYDEWVSRETDGKNAGYTDTKNAAGVNSGLFAEEDIVDGTGEYVDAEENATNNAPTANEAEASGMTAEEYAKTLEQAMNPAQQTEAQTDTAQDDIASAFAPFYNGDVINAGAVEEAIQNGTVPVESIENIPIDEDIRNDKTTTNELIEREQREYAEKLAAQEAPHTQQETPQSVQSGSNISATPTQENASQKPQASAVAPVSAEKQRAISAAESYGESGRVPFSLLVGDDMGTKLDSVRELTPKEREEAYLRGKKRAESKAQKQQDQRDAEANGNTGWRRGNVIGDGVKISDMKETFNDPQGLSYTILSTISEVTGIDIILYRSEAENGVFTMYEGKFKKSTDQIYLDLNSGLMRSMDADQLSKYVMLRTFGHEITHFDEKWSPVLYNEFRQAVFDHMEKNGTDVDALIREQQDNGMSYEAASREVVADAMTDVLPDSNFVEMLAKEHRTVFQRILDKLKEFVAKVKEAFAKMVPNNKAAANAMKENVDGTLRYAQNIVDLFDRMTVDAVERYQRARATQETVATTEKAVEADAGGTKETRTPVSLNSLIAKAETYADDQTGKQQLTKLIKDAYDRGKNRKRVTVDDILSGARDIVDTDTGKEQLAGLVAAAYLRGQSNAQNAAKRKETVNSELYKHFFEGPTPEEAMDALKKVGFTRWQKNGKDRLYINADSLGLEITWGKRMGQVESASFQGEDISKRYASELRSAKTYVDVKTQEIIGTDEKLKEIATNLYMETLTKAYEDAANSSTNAKPVKTASPAVETTSPVAEETAPTETAAPAEETAPESKPTVEEAKANLKKSIKVPVETTNAKALEHGIKTETLSIDSVTFGTPPAGFNSMQQQAIASGLIEGVYKDEHLIKLDVPYDGQFTIENTVQNVVRILEKLHVKATQEATITKELARLLKKGGAVARSGDVYFAGTNKVMLRVDKDTYDFAMSPKYEGGYDAMPHTFGESFVDNLKKDGPAPVPVVADISAGAGFGGEYYVFDVSGEKAYFRKSDISLIDGNGRTLYVEKVKSNVFYASTFDENGVCGIVINVRLESPTTVYTKPSNLKCFKKTNNPNNNMEADTNDEETERSGSGESPVRSDNVGAVPVSDPDGERAARLVDEREAGDVQRDGGRGESASGAEEEGGPVQQTGDNVHEAGASGVRGEGTGESGLSDLNPAELEDRDRQQKSTEEPGGSNFIIGDSLNLPGGEKGKYKANVKALRLAHQIQTENRFATAEEQEALSKYVGWCGLSKAFGRLINASDRNNRNGYSPDAGWEKELDEIWSLVDDGVITTAELRSMANSSTNAHYTSIEVVKAMWDGLRSLGFKGGRLMEPSCGTGNFVGGMPADMLPGVRSWTMVELDRVTGGIAKLLYPHADVKIQGFQDAKIPDNMLDVVIGNVPFGKSDFVDKRYPKNITDSLHDYFFIKSLDKVRPGGIVMMLTSMYTMDKKDSKVRDYIAARADLIGAVRLPNTAFIENAATSVVTDMLILKKRKPGTPYGGEAFVNLSNNRSQVDGAANYDYAYDYFLNEYFVNHPEMVLGTPDHGTMYGGRDEITYNPIKDGRTLRQQITDAISTIQARMEYPETVSAEKANVRVENAEKKGGTGIYQVKDGQLVKVDGGAVELSSEDQARMVGIVGIRNAYQNLVAALNNGYAPDVVSKARNELNAAYDTFVAKYGYINSQKNSKLIEDDPAQYQLLALEVDYDKGNAKRKIPASARKADIFTKDTISPNVTIKSVDTVEEGIIASINVSGGIDPEYIGKLMGKTGDQMSELLDASEDVFRDDSGNFQYRERYLSGNVRAKLEKARYLAERDKRYEKNVRALEAVMPEDIPAGRVQSSVNIGARWIDTEYYTDFLKDRGIFYGSVYLNAEGYYDVTGRMSGPWAQSNSIKRKHGGTRTGWDAVSIFEKVLNGRQLVVYDTIEGEDGKKKSVVNKDDTQAAERIGTAMRSEFQEWLFEDKTRSEYLTKTFNEQFNSYVTPKYDGSKLTIKGLSPSITLRPHQKNAVQRMLMSGGNTLLAHCVGAGKTAVVASTVMKLREIGAIKRPLIICPKSLVAQWGTEFRKFFPTANLLVADAKNFSKEKRAVFAANIRNGDYDAIVMSYQNFSEIPLSEAYLEEFKESLTSREIQSKIDDAISKGKGGLSAKKTASAEASLKKQLDGLMNLSKNALIPTFEEFGFDGIFVDEAHNFKNLWYKTNLQNVGGLGSGETKSAMDLYAKIRYLQKLNGGRGVALVTATPVMNSIVEMYTMQRYLQGDLLKQLGITTFDAWAGMFGVTEKVWELNAAGNYTQKTVMAKYTNIPALMQLYGQIADTVTKIDAKIPERVDELVEIPMSHAQREYMKDLNERANNKENPLKLTGDGRKMAYSIHMVDETEGYEPGCKIYVAADKINEIYKKSTGVTVNDEDGNQIKVNGTQIVFLDMGVPKAKTSKTENTSETTEDFDDEETENATLYEALKRKLIEDGIPDNEIAFIHDAKTDKQKEALRDSMNAGTTRVLIGSTGKMGVGMNAQRLCVALHNVDCPWRPGDLEQRIGRAIRQGNLFSDVEIIQYATVGSFDSAMWSKVDRKAKMIQQVTSGEFVGDTFEADEGDALSYAQIAAISSGNPKILQLLNAQKQLEGYESAYRYYVSSRNSYLSEAEDSKRFAAKAEAILSSLERAKEIIEKNPNYGEKFSIEIGGKKYIKAKDANKAFAGALESNNRALFGKTIDIGTFCGIPITARIVDNKFNRDWEVSLGDISTRWASDVSDWATTFSNVVKGIDKAISAEKTKIETFKNAAEERTQLANKPFEGTEEWEAAKREVLALQEELGMLDRPNAVGDDEEGDEQYSRRSSSMTDRDILEMAADMVDESNYTDGEKDALRIFKERLTTLQELTEQREDMGKTYRAQQFGKPADRKGAEQTLARMKILDGRIEKARNAVLDVESKPVLRDVLSKSRNILEQQGKAATKAALNKLRAKTAESAGVKKYRKRIADDVADITKWITNPSNKSSLDRVPDAIKNPVIDFLNALDFTSKRALKGGAATKADAVVMARAKRLSEAMKKGFDVNEAYARYELPDDFFDRMDDFIRAADAYASAGEFTINEMTAQELKVLSGLVKSLKQFIRQVNAFHQNAIFEHVSEASQSSMEFMRELGEAKRDGNLDNFLLWQNIRPAYGFERFGRGGEAIWDELRRGQDKLAFNTVEISDFVKQTYTPEQVKEWSETVEVFEIGDEKEPVSIPVAYLMGLYELSKDQDGARHILEGGIRVAPFTVGKNRVTNNGVDMTQLSLSEMVDRLKKKYPEAAETADKMQRFMARTGGKMANEVSMARFGEEMFTNEKYYPISSDGRLFDVSADKPYDNQNLYALLNMSFTKNRIEGANNRVVIYNIFDVFSNHMSGVATYNALALPVLDTLKWLNYRETVINETGDVVKGERLTEVMDRTFGGGNDEAPGSNARGYATKFVLDIVRSYNGTTPQSSPIDRFAINALHHYNVAQVAFNGRVVIQQPLAIVRAGMYLNIGDITGAIASFRKGKAYYTEKHNEMLRNSGIAAWKDLGFYDVNISRGLTDLIKQDDSKVDKLNDFGLKAAEAADSVTWTAIWVASEKAAERKGFAPDSERYMEEAVRIFEEVIYKTQVVDSVLTKTAWLRDKGAVARATGSFMNEPVTTYNLLVDAYDKFNMDKRQGMSNQQAWQKNGKRIARIALIYGLTALTNAMITAMADAWRDDDDYQTALEKWWEAFRGNIVDELIPFNKLPLVSEAYDLILMTLNKMGLNVAGYEPNSFLFQWSDDWLKAVEIISDKMKGEDTNYTWYAGIYYLLRASSGMTGVPLGSITREVSDIWNNSVGALAPSTKIITYEPGVKNNIKYALWDGYLTEAEAADALVKAGIMNAADAREQARHWAYTNSNPDSTLTLTQLSNYDKYASPAGITIDEYENFLLSIKDYKGDTKKDRIVEKINAMPVSARQKDAYFYAAGYKSSTLEQTPWHFDMSGWQIDDYKEYGAPAGIPKETFKTFTETASKIKGDDKNGDGKTDSGSKKAKVIAYIDGLSLTPDQKDALYYQQGYAESKIGDTPWH